MAKLCTIQETKARADQYRFLASAFLHPPTPKLLDNLRRLGLANGEGPDIVTQEFNNLFKVPLGQYTTPYEAVYRDERDIAGEKARGLLAGPSTVDALRHYREAGAKLDQTIKELPDHIGVELAFMEFLCSHEITARRQKRHRWTKFFRQKEHAFLRDHLAVWVPLLAASIHTKARLGFYKNLATVMQETVQDHLAQLSEMHS